MTYYMKSPHDSIRHTSTTEYWSPFVLCFKVHRRSITFSQLEIFAHNLVVR